MKQRNFIRLNVAMTKHLFVASPHYFWVNLVNSLQNAGAFIAQTLLYKYIIDAIIYGKLSLADVAVWFGGYYVLLTVKYAINFLVQNKFNEIQKGRITLYYKKWICGESVKKNIALYHSPQYKDMVYNAVYGDGEYLIRFSERLFALIYSVIVLIFFVGVFAGLHPMMLIMILVLALKNMKIGSKKSKVQYERYRNNLPFERTNTDIHHLFLQKQYVRELRLYPIGDLLIDKFAANKQAQWKADKHCRNKAICLDVTNDAVDLLVHVANLIVLTWLLFTKAITVGEFSLLLTNFTTAVNNLQGILSFPVNIWEDGKYIGDIYEVADKEDFVFPRVQQDTQARMVAFKDISYAYNEEPVLKDINIELPLDKKIAIVGENGSGKSTFMKLLLGLYRPVSGEIHYYYPEQNVKNSLDLFGIMLQDYRIFPLSIKENIVLGEETEEDQQRMLADAISFSELDKKIEAQPNGTDAVLTGEFAEGGTGLSGGELQRVAISRAYYGEKPVLILDEPASNLDPAAQRHLMSKLRELPAGRGVILSTHNILETQNLDMVLTFKDGRIVEYGTPEELLEKKGYYYEMYVTALGE